MKSILLFIIIFSSTLSGAESNKDATPETQWDINPVESSWQVGLGQGFQDWQFQSIENDVQSTYLQIGREFVVAPEVFIGTFFKGQMGQMENFQETSGDADVLIYGPEVSLGGIIPVSSIMIRPSLSFSYSQGDIDPQDNRLNSGNSVGLRRFSTAFTIGLSFNERISLLVRYDVGQIIFDESVQASTQNIGRRGNTSSAELGFLIHI